MNGMIKTHILKYCFLLVLIGCANTYKLEKKSTLSFSESYYKFVPSGIRGGNSAYNIYLTIDKSSSLDKKDVKILGVYFKEKYAKFKRQGLGTYQAYVKEKSTANKLAFDTNTTSKIFENTEQKTPFNLKENEAVICYLMHEKRKYLKIILTKKKVNFFPM
jgi:hypothetical protein